MTDRENFLERWSRRKIEAERQTPDDAQEQAAAQTPEDRNDETQDDTQDETRASAPSTDPPAQPARSDKPPAPTDSKPGFDLASLPSLDSITAATDVRAFLAPGVPAELARAALRRAWAADPAIRDFKGLAENDWDFTDPKAMAGFSDLPGDFDVKKVIAEIFGEKDRTTDSTASAEPEPALAAPAQQSEPPREFTSADETEPAAAEEPATPQVAQASEALSLEVDLVQRNNIAAAHNNISIDKTDEPKIRRLHGRALPQ
jgi:hypothetical protein